MQCVELKGETISMMDPAETAPVTPQLVTTGIGLSLGVRITWRMPIFWKQQNMCSCYCVSAILLYSNSWLWVTTVSTSNLQETSGRKLRATNLEAFVKPDEQRGWQDALTVSECRSGLPSALTHSTGLSLATPLKLSMLLSRLFPNFTAPNLKTLIILGTFKKCAIASVTSKDCIFWVEDESQGSIQLPNYHRDHNSNASTLLPHLFMCSVCLQGTWFMKTFLINPHLLPPWEIQVLLHCFAYFTW